MRLDLLISWADSPERTVRLNDDERTTAACDDGMKRHEFAVEPLRGRGADSCIASLHGSDEVADALPLDREILSSSKDGVVAWPQLAALYRDVLPEAEIERTLLACVDDDYHLDAPFKISNERDARLTPN